MPPPLLRGDERPRVLNSTPTRGYGRAEAFQSHYALPTRGKVQIIPGLSVSSLLCHAFNLMWAMALNWRKAGLVDWWCLHHDDVEVRTHGWLDLLVAEAKATGAALLSVVQAIKDDRGESSTAVETDDPWRPRKLTLAELGELPETFSIADTPWPDSVLLVNTGLLLVDLSRPEWFASNPDGSLYFHFTIGDRIVPAGPDGELQAQVKSEDWNFSRLCHSRGLPVYATRKIDCLHYGSHEYTNQPPAPVEARQLEGALP